MEKYKKKEDLGAKKKIQIDLKKEIQRNIPFILLPYSPEDKENLQMQQTHKKNIIYGAGKKKRWTKEDFIIGKCLGRGKYGMVHIAKEKELNFIVALKIMNKSDLKEPNAQEQILREIKIQSYLDHPNILKLYGYFDDEEKIYLILEYAAWGELYSTVKK